MKSFDELFLLLFTHIRLLVRVVLSIGIVNLIVVVLIFIFLTGCNCNLPMEQKEPNVSVKERTWGSNNN
jgi:uncharacterized membrane protein